MLYFLTVIRLNRLSGFEIIVNPELIEWIESNPDTTISLATGSKIVVKNSTEEVIQKVMDYRRAIMSSGKNSAEILLKSYSKEA